MDMLRYKLSGVHGHTDMIAGYHDDLLDLLTEAVERIASLENAMETLLERVQVLETDNRRDDWHTTTDLD